MSAAPSYYSYTHSNCTPHTNSEDPLLLIYLMTSIRGVTFVGFGLPIYMYMYIFYKKNITNSFETSPPPTPCPPNHIYIYNLLIYMYMYRTDGFW